MSKHKYAIIDIETTGGFAKRDKITEIAIILHDGVKITDQFESLVNPERSIPPEITRITGINDDMVRNAPKFYELAKKIVEITEGAVFVAHNVRFDYSFIKEEFRQLGYTYTRRQLCTVKLTRKSFPNLSSYGLGNLIRHFNIPVENRHRALDDALATTEIFSKILNRGESKAQVKELVNLGIKETQLPKNISLEQLHGIPEETGVYYFFNSYGDVIYVGKALNIKTRVFQHFRKTGAKSTNLYQRVADIDYVLTGSELIALLLETKEIKEKSPEINKAQKKKSFQYFLTSYTDEDNYLKLDIVRNSKRNLAKYSVYHKYSKLKYGKYHLLQIINEYELCQKRTFLAGKSGLICPCFGLCKCDNQETYNQKVLDILAELSYLFEDDFIILDEGRSKGEKSIVAVIEGKYIGYGYMMEDEVNGGIHDLRDAIQRQPYYPIMNRFIWNYLKSSSPKVIKLKSEE